MNHKTNCKTSRQTKTNKQTKTKHLKDNVGEKVNGLGFEKWMWKCQSLNCVHLCNLMNCSPSGSSVNGILQARLLEWVAITFSRRASQLRHKTCVSYITYRFFIFWAMREVLDFGYHILNKHQQHDAWKKELIIWNSLKLIFSYLRKTLSREWKEMQSGRKYLQKIYLIKNHIHNIKRTPIIQQLGEEKKNYFFFFFGLFNSRIYFNTYKALLSDNYADILDISA